MGDFTLLSSIVVVFCLVIVQVINVVHVSILKAEYDPVIGVNFHRPKVFVIS